MASDTDIAWLAGIVDGEGCFTVKRPIRRKSGENAGKRTSYQLWMVVCNTSKPMMDKMQSILETLGIEHQPMRKVWKGARATRWQYWLHVAKKAQLLKLTKILLPYLVAKKHEALTVIWFLEKACKESNYRSSQFDQEILDALSLVKRNGGEVPAELANKFREIIPSQAWSGQQ